MLTGKHALFLAAGLFCTGLAAATAPATPRDSNFGNTAGYDGTRIEAQLLVGVREQTKVVHFIRDNNDPRVVTKTYLLKHVDAYEFRDYLRQMVQAKRVGNTALQQVFPLNTAAPNVATTSSASPVTPAAAQPGYSPQLQLGSNTAVECLKYVDGTGLLIVSAEEYRFQDHENGMGLDSLVEFLDKPQMGAFFGTQTFFYVPKFVPARNLLPLIQNVGMNVTDISEVWQGMDVVAEDPDLNWLIFDVTNYSMFNIEKMLRLYDVPIPQVRLQVHLYEIYRENDERIGIDFQAWKNNEGMDFFSAGGRFRDNWSAAYNGGFTDTPSERTRFFNFNPKWNTRYIDFLAASGKAKLLHKGELLIRNNMPSSLERTTQIFYMDTTQDAPGTSTGAGVGPYKLLSALIQRFIAEAKDYPVAKGNRQKVVTKNTNYGFTLTVSNASVNLKETRLDLELKNSSLIGYESTGAPRIAQNNTVSITVSLPHGSGDFVIGGLRKLEMVKSRTGIPWLCQIPYLGYLFSSEGTSVKDAELVAVCSCRYASPQEHTGSGKSKHQTR